MSSTSRIAELAAEIRRLKRLYYMEASDTPDAVYDAMEDELRRLDPTNEVLSLVGTDFLSGERVAHQSPMLSLDKTYSVDELHAWVASRPVVGSLKLDGLAISLVYEDGVLSMAKTRGDGVMGEVVTQKIRHASSVLKKLPLAGGAEVRGEVCLSKDNFELLAAEMETRGLARPTSPRNIVAGIFSRKGHEDLGRYLTFFAYDISAPALSLEKETAKFAWLEKSGFVTPSPILIQSKEELVSFLGAAESLLKDGPYGMDGAVFSFEDLSLHESLGSTGHHPRYKIAFKWQGEIAESEILGIAWETSRFGILTPVANVSPTYLSGAMITNVTLHNAEHVRLYNLKKGDVVWIVRSGEVIPKFLGVHKSAEGSHILPSACPSCESVTEFDGVRLKCSNTTSCPAQSSGAILNWIKVMKIDDLSDKRLEALIEAGLVSSIPDLYRLASHEGVASKILGPKMFAKITKRIEDAKTPPLTLFLKGLGILGLGATLFEKLLAVHPTLSAVLSLSEADIMAVDGFGAKNASSLVSSLIEKKPLIDELFSVGVNPREVEAVSDAASGDGRLAGMTIVITGALSRPREEIERAIKAVGGKISSSVSKTTSVLLTNEQDSNSSKAKKARELGVRMMSEEEFERLLADTEP